MKKICLALAAATAVWGAQAAPVTYASDATHTFVLYETAHMGISTNRGRFEKVQAHITLDQAKKTGRVEVQIDPASVHTGVAALDEHLQGKDFFNVAAYPKASFQGDQFTFDAKGNVQSVAGGLTLLGKTLPVTLQAKHFACFDNPMTKHQTCGGDFEATIDRSKWGMDYALKYPGMSPQVHLLIQIEASAQP